MEVLRLVLMLAIFAWHILVHGYGFKDVAQSGMALTGNGAGIILASLFAPATYCFMFISGYYGMKFSVKKGLTIELWLVITSILTFSSALSSSGLSRQEDSLKPASRSAR